MQIIPVIDLLAGQVVRAIRGERANYRPVCSDLCASAEPLVVARALLDYTGADTLYLADLDALTGGALQAGLIAELVAALPGTTFWLDGGFADRAALDALPAIAGPTGDRLLPVLASEALTSPAAARDCLADPARAILSLDRRGDALLDPAGCWADTTLWPERLIVMTLERVGAFCGPDLATLAAVRRRAPRARLIGAGGIRDAADLAAASAAGADAWLVASALHDRRLPPRPGRG